ncbi:hypothetical protein L1987_17004 [Smallanthus sonchifolius]|uniref:Uncharacterized protein n=1 Tax=Smallanthus sonchifolius TaxID=185202 RepID=A0ACB9IWS9_9ASTR|nr:hypothetical protein L1987_17004 [Smallanthus sonchifolius]
MKLNVVIKRDSEGTRAPWLIATSEKNVTLPQVYSECVQTCGFMQLMLILWEFLPRNEQEEQEQDINNHDYKHSCASRYFNVYTSLNNFSQNAHLPLANYQEVTHASISLKAKSLVLFFTVIPSRLAFSSSTVSN